MYSENFQKIIEERTKQGKYNTICKIMIRRVICKIEIVEIELIITSCVFYHFGCYFRNIIKK